MKVGLARGPGVYGGIYRRFRALVQYCEGRHEAVGLQIFGDADGEVAGPVRTLAFPTHALPPLIWRAATAADVLASLEPLITRVAAALAAERCDRVLAADTDLKGLIVVAACRRIGVPVTTFVASVARHDSAFEGRAGLACMPDVERYVLEQSQGLIFPSEFARRECAVGAPAMAPAQVVYNGIAPECFEAPRDGHDPAVVGAVMRLSSVKNPAAIRRMSPLLAGHGIRLELVTDVSTARPAMVREVAGVQVVPPTSDTRELARFYARCRAIVCPSHFEASGNVPMEALAAGTPAIVTDRMGIAEVYPDFGLADLVVGVDDDAAMVAQAIHARPVGDAVRRRLASEFAWPAVCARIVAAM